jgi:hypothetical protein
MARNVKFQSLVFIVSLVSAGVRAREKAAGRLLT